MGNVPGDGFYLGKVAISDHTAFEAPDPGYWVPSGYAVILFHAFCRLKSEHKWLYSHRRQKWGCYYGEPELELQKRLFDRFLKGRNSEMDGVPKVRLEIHSNRFDYKVVHAEDWPLPGTRYKKLYLDAGSETLAENAPESVCDTAFDGERAGDNANRVLFDYVFEKDTDLIGHMALRLYIEAEDTDDLDIFVGVEKLDQGGDEIYFFSDSGGYANGPVTRGWLRASNRNLNTERSTQWRPVLDLSRSEPMPQNKVVAVDIPLMPFGTSFCAGEKLRLVIQSWSFRGQWEGGSELQWDT